MTISPERHKRVVLTKAEESAVYGGQIVGRTFTVVRTSQLKTGDVVIRLNSLNIGYEWPLTVSKITKFTAEIYDVEFVGQNHKEAPRFAHNCLFGKLKNEDAYEDQRSA